MTRAMGQRARRRDPAGDLAGALALGWGWGVAVVLSDGRRVVVSTHAAALDAHVACDRATLSARSSVLFAVVQRLGGYRIGDSWEGGPL